MQAAQDREGDDLATCILGCLGSSFLLWNLLSDPLMRSCLVKVGDIRTQDPALISTSHMLTPLDSVVWYCVYSSLKGATHRETLSIGHVARKAEGRRGNRSLFSQLQCIVVQPS